MSTVNARMAQITHTTAEWASITTILEKGEIAYEATTTGEYLGKVGDGVHQFSGLPYAPINISSKNLYSFYIADASATSYSANINTSNKTITFPKGHVCLGYKLIHSFSSPVVLDYSSLGTYSYGFIYYNASTQSITIGANYENNDNIYYLGIFVPYAPNKSIFNFNSTVNGNNPSDILGDNTLIYNAFENYIYCTNGNVKVDYINKKIDFPSSGDIFLLKYNGKYLSLTSEYIGKSLNFSNDNYFQYLFYDTINNILVFKSPADVMGNNFLTTMTYLGFVDIGNRRTVGINPIDLSRYADGKSIGCLGDSITYGLGGTSWVTKLADYCGFSTVVNYGVNGSLVQNVYNDGKSFVERYSSMQDNLDYIIVWGGVNDFMWGNTSINAFSTAYESLISGLLTKYPSAKFLGITPMKFEFTGTAEGILSRKWDTARTDGSVLKNYRDAEIDILNKYSVPVFDLFNESGISPENLAQSTRYFNNSEDHLHPNTDGNLIILAPKIASKINEL